MTVADRCAHLTRGEIEDFLSGGIPDIAPLRPVHDFWIGVAPVSNQVLAKVRRLVVFHTHGVTPRCRAADSPAACARRMASNASRPCRMCRLTAQRVAFATAA